MADSPGRLLKRLGLVLLVLGAAVGITFGVVGGIKVGRTYLDALTGPVYTAPVQTTVELKQARYEILQDIGSSVRFTGGGTDIMPSSVQVTGPGGVHPDVAYVANSSLTIDRDNENFRPAVEFEAPVAGQYQVSVAAPSGAKFLVARDVGQSFADAGGWFGLTGLGILAFVAGFVLLLIGFGQQRKGSPTVLITYGQQPQPFQPVPAPPMQTLPPPGWYRDPQNPAGTRFWDGQRWLP